MRVDLIAKVEFRQLRNDSYDRRGTIAVFHLKEIPNLDYLYMSTAISIRKIIGLLGDTYDMNWSDLDDVRSYAIGEAQDCWLNRDYHPPKLILDHKYWGQEQIDTFYALLSVLAKLYKWELIDNREEQNG